jgi:hypothetical protein
MLAFYIGGFVVVNMVFFNTCFAIVTDQTVHVAHVREGYVLERKRKAEAKLFAEMRDIFQEADEDGSGEISYDEFEAQMLQPDMERRLDQLHIPRSETEDLFKLLDRDGSGSITLDELMDGLSKCRGDAQSADLVRIQIILNHELKRATECIAKVERTMNILHNISGRVDEWWIGFESRNISTENMLAERRLWFVRHNIKGDLITLLNDIPNDWLEWMDQNPIGKPAPPSQSSPSPPRGAPPKLENTKKRTVSDISSLAQLRQSAIKEKGYVETY